MGISETNKVDVRISAIPIRSSMATGLDRNVMLYASPKAQNNAFAGVGSPRKELVCRSSRLNFASLRAENAGIRNANQAH